MLAHTLILSILFSLLPIINANSSEVIQVPAQILSSSVNWDRPGATYKLKGLIQVPRDLAINVGPGVTVDASDGNLLLLGSIKFAGSSSSRTKLYVKHPFLDDRSTSNEMTFSFTDVKGVLGFGSIASYRSMPVQISDSTFTDLDYLFGSSRVLSDITIIRSFFRNVRQVFDASSAFGIGCGQVVAFNVNISENYFLDLQCFPSFGQYDLSWGTRSLNISSNIFRNEQNALVFDIRENDNVYSGYTPLKIENNSFLSINRLVLVAANNSNYRIAKNYWTVNNETEIRKNAKVIDGKTDISIQTIIFEPLLLSQPTLPISNNLYLAYLDEVKETAELKAKQEAEAKAAAELKAKQEAEAKAAAELKAKQEAEAKAAAELKAKQEAEAKAAAELKAKQEAEAKAAAELKAKQDADKAAQLAALKAALLKLKTPTPKKTTITCIKGKTVKKVTAIKPVCPKGYKKK